MSLISCQSVGKTFGVRLLFENVSLTIAEGERVGLIGPNGAGKTTLLKIIAGLESPDSGTVTHRKMLRLGYVEQENSFGEQDTVRSVGEDALAGSSLDELEREAQLNVTLGRTGFTDFEPRAQTLSGGWRKRLAIARELLRDPDVLLLDEPTNHLDIESILWLERLLAEAKFASVVRQSRPLLSRKLRDRHGRDQPDLPGRLVSCSRRLQRISAKARRISGGRRPSIARVSRTESGGRSNGFGGVPRLGPQSRRRGSITPRASFKSWGHYSRQPRTPRHRSTSAPQAERPSGCSRRPEFRRVSAAACCSTG